MKPVRRESRKRGERAPTNESEGCLGQGQKARVDEKTEAVGVVL